MVEKAPLRQDEMLRLNNKDFLFKDNISKEDIEAIKSVIFSQASHEDVAAYEKQDLIKAATLATKALKLHKRGQTICTIDRHTVMRQQKPISIITLVNDNKPFLLDSVMNIINAQSTHIYLVAHPVITVEDCDKDTIKESDTIKPKTKRRISLMQIHIQYLTDKQSDKLQKNIVAVLEQVNAAVRDWPKMLYETQKVIAHYQQFAPEKYQTESLKLIEFLQWLVDNNFTFLGMRAYDFHAGKDPMRAFSPRSLELGILTDATIRILGDANIKQPPREILSFMESDTLFIVTKANSRSKVHRSAWLDYIGIKLFDDEGHLKGELRIVGFFTSTAYTSSVLRIPFLKEKAKAIIENLGFNATDHSGKALINVLESYPRDEMFRANLETLTKNASLILELGERPRLRVLPNADSFGRFIAILVYVPRDRYDTNLREKIGMQLLKLYEGDFFEFHPMFLEGALTRVYYIIHRKSHETAPIILQKTLEETVASLMRNWQDLVEIAGADCQAKTEEIDLAAGFPESYRDIFDAKSAIEDSRYILALDDTMPLNVVFYHQKNHDEKTIFLKIFHRHHALALSERVPLLENMGFRVIAEQTLALKDKHGHAIYLHDMQLENAFAKPVVFEDGGALLATAFKAIWAKDCDDDAFNALTQNAHLEWQDIVILRHYGRYLQQAGIPYAQNRLAQTLNHYPAIARDLFQLFCLKFDPKQQTKDNEKQENIIQKRIEEDLQHVPSLDDDLILRRFRNLIAASVRSNAFKIDENGKRPRILATKLNPHMVEGLVEPRPYREIFVYGPDVEGVHLRFGKVARGGIRWSDRALDYRTEVLGLVKAQQVKNAVIVPVGSKGGFYPHNLPKTTDRAKIAEAAREAYIQYIGALLSITDNLHDGKVVAPKNIIRHDGDDPYFVVAADKGTATFSDTANMISQKAHFWLDDAFASGGSAGYDHKQMGITAKGAWEAVKRHFRELFDKDIQTTPFSCVGVGDMSGDVFGNGMLLSKQTKLIAAFDHRDIFIDPNPDCAISYNERARLFALPRSSWQDYNQKLLSKGGGVFSRALKTITLSKEAAEAIGIKQQTGTPFEIISAILKADVDLLWFGGIGTYIRAESENNADVGDRANDVIRIMGREVRAKVIGEGANLGMTQRGRIEYSMYGGRCDTDAIDNSAGVNCSDVEVNIKIALASAMRDHRLDRKKRDILLKEMTEQVSHLVLKNNYLQSLTLSLAESRNLVDLPYQLRFMNDLERKKLLDRQVEILPSDQILQERLAQKQGLTRPELSVIMAYAKLTLQEELTNSALIKDDYLRHILFAYFPREMQKDYAKDIENHQLRFDILATLLANDIVNRGGPTFVHRLQDKSGQSVENVVRAYLCVRDGFGISPLYEKLDALDNQISGKIQNQLYSAVTNMLFITTSWILRNVDLSLGLGKLVATILEARELMGKQLPKLMPNYMQQQLNETIKSYMLLGTSKVLAKQLALLEIAKIIPDIALVARQADADMVKTAQIYFKIVEMLRINRIEEASQTIPIVDYYDGMALAQANDVIDESLRKLVFMVIQKYGAHNNPVQAWLEREGVRIEDMVNRMGALIEGDLNISRFTFAATMMANLASKI